MDTPTDPATGAEPQKPTEHGHEAEPAQDPEDEPDTGPGPDADLLVDDNLLPVL